MIMQETGIMARRGIVGPDSGDPTTELVLELRLAVSEEDGDAEELLRRRLSAGALRRIANYAAFVLSGMDERETLTVTPRVDAAKS
jgi:hypothetical protein